MKRRIFMIILVVILACLAVVLSGCDKKPIDKGADIMRERVSYAEKGVFSGGDKDYNVKLVYGDKEENFIADGKIVNVQPFAALSVTPVNMDNTSKTYAFKLIGTKGEASGNLQKNLLGASYGINLKFDKSNIIDAIGDPQKVVVTTNNTSVEIPLVNNMKDYITYDKAIEYAYGALKDYIKANVKDGVLDGEVYARLLRDKSSTNPKYYWYVAIMKDVKSFANVLIDPVSGAVLTIKLPS